MAWFFFLLSGMTGLIYEVLWTRRLTLTFGHTVLAVSTVLTAFMAGLALGSYLGGAWSDRRRARSGASFLRSYGILELVIGAWAMLSLPLLGIVEGLYLRLATSGVEGPPLFLACFVLSVAILLPPTTAMGATLPIISQYFVRSMSDLGEKLSRLYGINTLGAVLGAALAGYLLLPTLGLATSVAVAASINIGIGAAAFYFGGRVPNLPESAPESGLTPGSGGWLLPFCFASTGLASMAFQVAWTRGLALSLGSSVYAFSTILVVFLSGLGIGSLAYGRLLGRRIPSLSQLGWLQTGVGLAAAATVPLIGYLPWIFYRLYPWLSGSYARVLMVDVALCAAVLILPTLLMGLTFPLVTQLYASRRGQIGKSIGAIYSANTLGCIVGSFLSGFLMVPRLGAQNTLEAAACLVFLVSGLILIHCKGRAAGAVPLVLAAAVWALPVWDRGTVGGGVAVEAGRYQGFSDQNLLNTMFRPPGYYRDGISSTVSLNYYGPEQMAIRVNGKVDASLGRSDRLTMDLLGLVPQLYQPKARSAVVIGLGSGFTLHALGYSKSLEEIHCVELEPAMIEANRYWAPFIGNILQDPRLKMHATDGRTYVLGSPRKFDIITSEPSNVWLAGIGNLYTVDFYKTCRERLNPGGVMCQWCNVYSLSPDNLRTVLRDFFEVFPYGDVWQPAAGDMILIGTQTPTRPDLNYFTQALQTDGELRKELVMLDLPYPESLMGHYVCPREAAFAASQGAAVNSDDRPVLEFSAPLSLYTRSHSDRNFALLRSLYKGQVPVEVDPARFFAIAYGLVNVSDFAHLQALLPQLPESPHTAWLSACLGRLQGGQQFLPRLKSAYQRFPNLALAVKLAESLLEAGDGKGALTVLKSQPGPYEDLEYPYRMALAGAYEQGNLWDQAATQYGLCAGLTRWSTPCTWQGHALFALQKLPEAEAAYRQALQRNPYDYLAWSGLGELGLQRNDAAGANQSFLKALEVVPDHPQALYGAALCEAQIGQPGKARKHVSLLLKYYPGYPGARDLERRLAP
jgi:spermidine synthase